MENNELNDKIGLLINKLGFTSSKFADYIEVRRPIISHIIAGRNKPSLEIIQRIVSKFPEMGIEWTFDGNTLDNDLLNKLANQISIEREAEELRLIKEEKEAARKNFDNSDLPVGSFSLESNKKVAKIVVFYEDNTFSEFIPA